MRRLNGKRHLLKCIVAIYGNISPPNEAYNFFRKKCFLGSILDAQGQKYWDYEGGAGGVTKPKFFNIQTTGGSVFRNIYLLNCAHFCVGVGATDVIIQGWTIDSIAGDKVG